VVDSIEAINGIGHAAVMCDPEFRRALAEHGYTLEPETGEVVELAPYAGGFSARAAQIGRNIDRYEAQWRSQHFGQEPTPRLRRSWDRRAWAESRPDKVVPEDGEQLEQRWLKELHALGFTPPASAVAPDATPIARIDRDAIAELAVTRIGGRRSSWNSADLRGEVERIVATADVVTTTAVRRELVEDLTGRAVERCVTLLDRNDEPDHVRALSSNPVLQIESDLIARLASRAATPGRRLPLLGGTDGDLDPAQERVVLALAGTADLLVIEGAAGSGKTAALATAHDILEVLNHRLLVVTPTRKAALVAQHQIGADTYSAAWLVHQHGYRWDDDGRWTRVPTEPNQAVRLCAGDVLLVDEAGMLDQDTVHALLTIADESHARIAFLGDRHQLPAVGRGGVLDLATRWAHPKQRLVLDTVHRFADREYADLSLQMRTGERSGEVFDALVSRGQVLVHRSEVERTAALTTASGLVSADTRDLVRNLNASIRDHRLTAGSPTDVDTLAAALTTSAGEAIGVGDRIATRRNDRDLGVSNRDCWNVTGIGGDGSLRVRGRPGERSLPREYVREHVELAYATTVYGAQGETVGEAHLLIGETTGAAATYVGMTRGRHSNTAHLVAESVEDARAQWIEVFSRDRADLGPTHAAVAGEDAIERFGPKPPDYASALQRAAVRGDLLSPIPHMPSPSRQAPVPGIGR
jgi:exodeoxyribonuclease V alpha subunit